MTRAALVRAWREGASILTLADLLGEDPRALEAALRLELAGDDESHSLRGAKPSPAEPRSPLPSAAEAEPVSTPPAGSASTQPGPGVADCERVLFGPGWAARPRVSVAAETADSSVAFPLNEEALLSAIEQVWDALKDGPKTFIELLSAVRPEQRVLVADAINVLMERLFVDLRLGGPNKLCTYYSRRKPLQ